jgi:hypothetical protein
MKLIMPIGSDRMKTCVIWRRWILIALSNSTLLFFDHSFRLAVAVPSAVDVVDLHGIGAFFRRLWESGGCRRTTSGLSGLDAVHHASGTTGSQLVDGANCINGSVKCTPGVEVLLDSRQKILLAFSLLLAKVSNPGVRKSFVGGHARRWIDGQTAADELAGSQRDAAPVFKGSEGVVGNQDSLHFFKVRVTIKGRVAAKKEVGDDANSPYVTVQTVSDDNERA